MTKINYCLLELDRKKRGNDNNSYWVVPMDQQKFKPFMRCVLVSGTVKTVVTSGLKDTTVIVKMNNWSRNIISSDFSSKSIVGLIKLVGMNATLVPD